MSKAKREARQSARKERRQERRPRIRAAVKEGAKVVGARVARAAAAAVLEVVGDSRAVEAILDRLEHAREQVGQRAPRRSLLRTL